MASEETIKNEARYWLVRQQSGDMSPDERIAFEQWLAGDERRKDEFERVASLWDGMEDFRMRSFPAREAALRYRKPSIFRLPALQLAAALTIVLAVTLMLVVGGNIEDAAETYRTAKGETTTVTLADGSRIELNTDTELRVSYSSKARTIHLNHGEALFTVADAHDRPFEVIAGSGRILDLSTSFNVYRESDRVSVTVVEGSVSVTTGKTGPIHLARGDALAYSAHGDLLGLGRLNPETATAWRERRVRFDQTPLREVMSQLARYHPIHYSFGDPEVGEFRISGTFRTDDLALLLDTLEAALPVHANVDGRFVRLDHAGN